MIFNTHCLKERSVLLFKTINKIDHRHCNKIEFWVHIEAWYCRGWWWLEVSEEEMYVPVVLQGKTAVDPTTKLRHPNHLDWHIN